MSKHSTIVGGSTADRLLNCPGSFQMIQRIPEQAEQPSEYAMYGTAMHAVMDSVLEFYAKGVLPSGKDSMYAVARDMVGMTFVDRVLDQEHLTDSIMPAIATLYELMNIYGGGFHVEANELKVKFPGIPGAFGTADLLLANKKFVLMIDWKFGQGVPVKAVIKDELGPRVNAQLMFYFAGAMAELPKLFTKKRFAVAIIQPRVAESLTHTVITGTEVDMFIEDMDVAIIRALDKNPSLNVGEHCRWCPARPFCPKHTEPLFELSTLGPAPARPMEVDTDDGDYGEFLGKAKVLADMAYEYKKQVDEQIHSYLENGGTVPGWKLKAKTKLRQWTDETAIAGWMKSEGFEDNEIWQTKLQTFAVADKAAKRHNTKIPDHFRVAPVTDETTVVPESDPAPKIDRKQAALEFSQALKELRHGT